TVARRDVPPAPERTHYRFELVGLRVRTRDGKHLGAVADVFSTGSNDVIVVRGEGTELLLPYLDNVVLKVDLERGEMVVEIPPGLNE
ncbi:MAG: 16S rRNA processing protein RimM, partial [Candidatus Eisenbacteria bacterium]